MNQDLTFMGNQFDEIVEIIDNARTRAMRAVNAELINMYWEIGAYISQKVEADGWGKSVVTEFSEFLRHRYPASKGFSAQNIWRMKQFYETYRGNEKLSPLVREISWTNNLLILTGCKADEAREFYLRLCAANNYSKRELDRQINSMLFERTMLSDTKNKELLTRSGGLVALRDAYVFEFLDVKEPYKERGFGLPWCTPIGARFCALQSIRGSLRQRRDGLRQLFGGPAGFRVGVACGPHLHQQGAGAQILVESGGPEL